MAILEGDIQILASQVMADVPEGGGAATGTVIVDGVSNNLFPDISELDRTVGRVNLRKVFPAVRTANTDGYYGAHVIVSDAPDDVNVSAVIFSTGDHFDLRTAAQSRIESYLAQGPLSAGILFGNHIGGMQTVTLLQRTNEPLLTNGDTFMLRKGEGLAGEVEQYLRVTDVSSRVREFTIPGDVQGNTFKRTEVSYTTSDPLRDDYLGFQAADSYSDAAINYTGKTKVYSTIVADAARYYGIVPLQAGAVIGDSVIYADGIYTQLVPSAQVETAIPDARMNQQSDALVSAGAPLTQTINATFSPSSSMYIGGGILPGSLTVTRSGITLTDLGGVLYNSATQVGSVDYENGLLQLSSTVWSGSGAHVITYEPASTPTTVTRSVGMQVTASSQRRTYVMTLDPPPAHATLQVSYLAGGRWYVLAEDGSGAVRGGDSAFGAGNLNYDTGTLSLTLGALPDVGSQVIVAWAPAAAPETIDAVATGGAEMFLELIPSTSIAHDGATISWADGSSTRTVTIAADGSFSGYGTGRLTWNGMLLSPTTLPAPGTSFTLTSAASSRTRVDLSGMADNGSSYGFVLGGGSALAPHTVRVMAAFARPDTVFPGVDDTVTEWRLLTDNGAGVLTTPSITGAVVVGAVNYTTGAVSINKSTPSFATTQRSYAKRVPGDASNPADPVYVTYLGTVTRQVTLTAALVGVPAAAPNWLGVPPDAGSVAAAAASFAAAGSAAAPSVTPSALVLTPKLGADFALATWATAYFQLGTTRYRARAGLVEADVSTATNTGTAVGTMAGNEIRLSTWPAGVAAVAANIRGNTAPALGANPEALTDGVTFRTASAPVKPGAFSVTGTLKDGTPFNSSAGTDGTINSGGVLGTIDYQTGVVHLRFGAPTADADSAAGVVHVAYLGLVGIDKIKVNPVQADTLRYNAVSYAYIPLDASILGLDPVRLPPDGRVPIFRGGTVAVVHNTRRTSPATLSAGQTIDVSRTRLARMRVIGADGIAITSGYTTDLDAGTLTVTSVTGWAQPVSIEHRIEDTALVSEAQINGTLKLTRPLTHAFAAGESFVSSALLLGDMGARVSLVYDQATWTDVWSDDVIGSSATASFDTINNPLTTSNLGAMTERWVLRFTNSTSFSCYGEHLGLVGTGNTASDFSPINPASGAAYFTVPAAGFGGGWAAGNALRINTVGALAPIEVARVIKQGPATSPNDSFSLLVRGDIDAP